MYASILPVSLLLDVWREEADYFSLFNFARIPLPGSDAFTAPATKALHMTVMIDDFMYSVNVFEAPSSPHEVPNPRPVGQIEQELLEVVADAKSRRAMGEQAAQVGILTADDRDVWCSVSYQSSAEVTENDLTL